MLRAWEVSKGVLVHTESEPEFNWQIGDSFPFVVPRPLVLMVDGEELAMLHRAMREHSWKGVGPEPAGQPTLQRLPQPQAQDNRLVAAIAGAALIGLATANPVGALIGAIAGFALGGLLSK
jgi:hypothetical protein